MGYLRVVLIFLGDTMAQKKLWITSISHFSKNRKGKRLFELWRHTKKGKIEFLERKWLDKKEILTQLPEIANQLNLQFDSTWYAQLLEWEYLGLDIEAGWIAGKNRKLQNEFRAQCIFKKTD